jgi:hypothetical protein
MKHNRIVRESIMTLKDIEKSYGAKVAKALAKYCNIKKLDINQVVGDLRTDGNGLTPWDKFDIWAKKTQGLDIMDNFDDTVDWSGAEDDAKREKEFSTLDDEEQALTKKRARKAEKLRRKKRQRASHSLREYDIPEFNEGSGSNPEDEYFISNWIGEQLSDCEWAHDVDYGESPIILTTNAGSFKIIVEQL